MCYDYRRMNRDLEILDENFNIIESFTIGESLMDKQIPCVKIGQGKTKILLAGAFHGLEYLTSAFLVKFLSELIVHIMTRQKLFGYDTERIFSEASIYVVPMVNPDGVMLLSTALILQIRITARLSVWSGYTALTGYGSRMPAELTLTIIMTLNGVW